MIRLAARAPAKVNLVLRVGAARRDGYHEVESLFAPVSLFDEVAVRVSRGSGVVCRVPGRPDLEGPHNLAAQAAAAFLARFAKSGRVEIRIDKRIPVTAGLGGGSSDAAAALKCLARAFGVRDRAALAELALQIGSDVPFFLGSGPAWARGRGELLTPAQIPALWLVLAYPADPSLAIRAGDAYRWLDADRPRAPARFAPRRGARTPAAAARMLANDLMIPAFRRHPTLAALARLLEGRAAMGAIMSGSGPTVFGVYADPRTARAAAGAVAGGAERGRAAVQAFVVRTLARLPGVTTWKSPRSASSR